MVEIATARPTFGRYLAERLRQMGLSQRELAERTGIDHSTISRIISQDRGATLNTAVCLLTALGEDVGVLGQIDL